jgi:ribose 5-phosphate isomerase B
MKKIYVASDHAGYLLKEVLVQYVRELGYEVEDCGAETYVEGDDFTDFVSIAARKVSEDSVNRMAIVLGGSGQGEAIVANRFPHVRAVVFNGQYVPADEARDVPNEIVLSREHNDANILSLGARFLNEQEAMDAVRLWLATPFSQDERHLRRIAKIEQYPHG